MTKEYCRRTDSYDLLDKSCHLVLSGFSKKKQKEILESL